MQRYFLNTDPDSGEVHFHGGCNIMQGSESNARDLGMRPSMVSAVSFTRTNGRNRRHDAKPCKRCVAREKIIRGRRHNV